MTFSQSEQEDVLFLTVQNRECFEAKHQLTRHNHHGTTHLFYQKCTDQRLGGVFATSRPRLRGMSIQRLVFQCLSARFRIRRLRVRLEASLNASAPLLTQKVEHESLANCGLSWLMDFRWTELNMQIVPKHTRAVQPSANRNG